MPRHPLFPQGGPAIATSRLDPLTAAGWSQFIWFALVATAWTAALFASPLDPDYTAGELLDHLLSWREGAPLYPPLGDASPQRVLNYPPLALLAARGLAGLGFSDLAAGRVANTLAFVSLVAVAAAWARSRGARGAALAGTVGLLGASFPVLYAAGQFRVEVWGAALTLGGFALLDRGRSARHAALAGAALALACFAKHTQMVPAVVALAFAWSHRRAAAPRATVAFLAAGAVGAAVMTAAWGVEPWRHLVSYTVGTYALSNLGLQALSYVAPWAVLLGFVAWTARGEGPGVRRDALVWMWAGAAAWSLSAARVGSSYSYFLDLHLATALWAGPRLFGSSGAGRPKILGALLAVQVLGANVGTGAALGVNLARLQEWKRELPAVCSRLGDGGAILSEDVGLARACGRTVLMHPFIMTSLAERGLWDPAPLEDAVARGNVPAVVVHFDPRTQPGPPSSERWTPGLLRAFAGAPHVEPLGPGTWVARW